MILKKIKSPEDIDRLSFKELSILASEMRNRIIEVASKRGGHVAPSLGVVELTIALLKVFKPPVDKIIWDVSHQSYGYKLLTGRNDSFDTLRQFGGISGFLSRSESIYDAFGAGHASTSLSAAIGFAIARDLRGDDYDVIAVIGDGALTGGMAMEGLNQIGYHNNNILVILNDNKMSIAENVGGMREYLTRLQSAEIYNKIMEDAWDLLEKLPKGLSTKAKNSARKLSEGLKNLIVPNIIFEEFGLSYYGPIDGHNIPELITLLSKIKKIKGAKLLHIITEKGRGYKPAEEEPTLFHGLGPFDPESGKPIKKKGQKNYSDIFGEIIVEEARENEDIIAITAAMPNGTGLVNFSKEFPNRFYDVGIAEQHAVTFAGGLAAGGMRPVCAIYSTFLQRAFDQIIHDIALQRLPVIFCIDRGGLVGEDGATHHGAFDLSYLRMIPNMVIMTPRDELEFKRMFKTALDYEDGPIAIRYPRGQVEGVESLDRITSIPIGKGEMLHKGDNPLVLVVGPLVYRVLKIAKESDDINPTIIDARFIKPLDEELILKLARKSDKIITVEDNAIAGGFGSAVMELLSDNGLKRDIFRIGIPDRFITYGNQLRLHESIGMGEETLKERMKEFTK
ncbi:1-deoxy-D-xylulose-5-phosphate synthase [candidate division WOR-3 bacterium]|nr:1-deoxy-D-xylulose-5-phosphate synthase [candidate division WOR-3 bacterium]MCK4527257.1 1-deoxy-D-xylulose-5-phosphate synthase [candidate division WOR-3 bacterium]